MSRNPWQVVPGEQLVELYQTSSLRDIVPKRSVVYSWRLSLRPPLGASTNGTTLTDWVDTLMALPLGAVEETRVSHTLRIESVQIRGGGLGEEKKRVLKAFLKARENRIWFLRYLESLGPISLALYTGETGNLYSRVRQHLDGLSDFGAMINGHSELSWEKLDLYYVDVGEPSESASKTRKLLEYITAVLTMSGFTKRPG